MDILPHWQLIARSENAYVRDRDRDVNPADIRLEKVRPEEDESEDIDDEDDEDLTDSDAR